MGEGECVAALFCLPLCSKSIAPVFTSAIIKFEGCRDAQHFLHIGVANKQLTTFPDAVLSGGGTGKYIKKKNG